MLFQVSMLFHSYSCQSNAFRPEELASVLIDFRPIDNGSNFLKHIDGDTSRRGKEHE